MGSVRLSGICKSFGAVEVIRNVDLEVSDGEFVVFVGPSGCGKSTLLRLICGLETMTEGSLEIDGASMYDVDPSKRHVAMVFQSYALYPHMTVEENMSFALRISGVPKAERARQVRDAARILQLEDLLDRKPKQLSGGQRQRVAIGRAIVRQPEVFLFDEPLSNLDAELRVQMRVEIAGLHRRLGTTMIYVTHDQVEAMTMADRIVVLRDGAVEQIGTPTELFDRPANRFVAGFIGSPRMNLLEAKVVSADDGGFDLALAGVDTPMRFPLAGAAPRSGTPMVVGIRPEHFVDTAEAPYALHLNVEFVERLGEEVFLHAPEHASGPVIVKQFGRETAGGIGPTTKGIDPARCHLFGPDGAALAAGAHAKAAP